MHVLAFILKLSLFSKHCARRCPLPTVSTAQLGSLMPCRAPGQPPPHKTISPQPQGKAGVELVSLCCGTSKERLSRQTFPPAVTGKGHRVGKAGTLEPKLLGIVSQSRGGKAKFPALLPQSSPTAPHSQRRQPRAFPSGLFWRKRGLPGA